MRLWWVFLILGLGLAGYWYLTEHPDKKQEIGTKFEELKQRAGFTEYVNKTPMTIDGVVTFLDTRGNRFDGRDIKVTVKQGYAEIYNGYINSNSEIILRDVMTWTLYNVSVVEGYGKARIYPVNDTAIAFEGNDTDVNVVIQERAFLRDLNVDVDNGTLQDDRIILDSNDGKHIILFDLKASGAGIVKAPRFVVTSGDISNFNAWVWIYNTHGLELPAPLEKGKVELGKAYIFGDLHERNGMRLALQIEKVSTGIFKIEVTDSEGLEKKFAVFEVI